MLYVNGITPTENEKKEILNIYANQQTTDRLPDGSYHINGDDAIIDVDIRGDEIIVEVRR